MDKWDEAAKKFGESVHRRYSHVGAGGEQQEAFAFKSGANYAEKQMGRELEELRDDLKDWENDCSEDEQYIKRLKDKNAELQEEVLAEHQAAVDMFGKYDELKDENIKLKEALESIASKHKPKHAKEEYWLKISHEQCATVLATDTKIARNALKGK
jgi:predicted nuclease with TOPRIM domain